MLQRLREASDASPWSTHLLHHLEASPWSFSLKPVALGLLLADCSLEACSLEALGLGHRWRPRRLMRKV
jgi:hypothetical protein